MGLPVVEDVPILSQLHQPAVDIAVGHHRGLGGAFQAEIPAAHQRPGVGVGTQGIVGQGIGHLVAHLAGIGHDVFSPDLPGTGGLVEAVALKAGAGGLVAPGQNGDRSPGNGLHVGGQFKAQAGGGKGAFHAPEPLGDGTGHAETHIQVDPAVLVHQHPGVEHLPIGIGGAVGQADLAVIGKGTGGGVGHRHPADHLGVGVPVEIIPAVGAPDHIGGGHGVGFGQTGAGAAGEQHPVAGPLA